MAMNWTPNFLIWFAGPGPQGPPGRLLPRWLFLRALGFIYFSAFFSLVSQIRGLMGPNGLLPAEMYLADVGKVMGSWRYWYAPTVLWWSSSDHALTTLCWIGMLASLLLFLNLWPRGMLVICFVLFLSFVSAAQDFSGYQSDGMLLSAGIVSIFFAPPGFRPGLGASRPPSRATVFLLQLIWLSIYFDSGVAKYFGGDPSWRNFTAMDEYYQNGPLPTWIGWYAGQLPHWFHASTAVFTVFVELVLVWLVFLPRAFRIFCFCVVTILQINIILTANYAFLNYLVLVLGFLLLDDRFLIPFFPKRWTGAVRQNLAPPPEERSVIDLNLTSEAALSSETKISSSNSTASPEADTVAKPTPAPESQAFSSLSPIAQLRQVVSVGSLWLVGFVLAWLVYANVFLVLEQAFRTVPLPSKPISLLQPFRVANQYGLFGRMTWRRYEIEFQGSDDGTNWTPYPYRFKPQNPAEAPGIYAPYQPRFDWNMWFASLDDWRNNRWVLRAEVLMLTNDRDVLALFAANPFPNKPPKQIRAVLWRYWFTNLATKRATGLWWRRDYMGLYAPALEAEPNGKFLIIGFPGTYPAP